MPAENRFFGDKSAEKTDFFVHDGNIVSSWVYVHGNGYFTILGEWAMISKMGQCPKLRLTVA